MDTKKRFPRGFLWGAATSSHQVEGATFNDWSEWEKKHAERLAHESHGKFSHLSNWEDIKPLAEDPANYISGAACDHYNRFREDFDIAKSLGHNAHRLSLEWSRIEPEKGVFDKEAIAHYREVIQSLRERGLEPFVTLWHWTNPVWLANMGGPANRRFAEHFENYARFVVRELGDLVTFWMTLNEPTSVIGSSYITGQWPPQKKSKLTALRVYHILAATHKRAYHAIREINPYAQVGFGNILHSYEPYHKHSFFDVLAINFAHFFTNRYMMVLTANHHDYLAVQYYFHNRFKFPRKVHLGDKPVSDLGWEIYPKGIYNVLKEMSRYGLPIYITENGLADAKDEKRGDFITEHLEWIQHAIAEGVPVKGYFYWSLLDNFEWDKGFWPRFGLVHVDFITQKRTIRESARKYAEIVAQNSLK